MVLIAKEKVKAPPLYIPEDEIDESCTQNGREKRTLIWSNRQGEVEEIGRIGEVGLHGRREVELSQIWTNGKER